MRNLLTLGLFAFSGVAASATTADYRCDRCSEWNAPQAPFKIFGDTWYVGAAGVSAVLVTSAKGHVLIDGGLPQTAPRIVENIRTLGFRIGDVKLILNSHPHFDHAGGLAALQTASGAEVAATDAAINALRDGNTDDPLLPGLAPYPAVTKLRRIVDGETVSVGDHTFVAHATPGHTAGSTSWTWTSCEGKRCFAMVYADSLTAPGYRLVGNPRVPDIVEQFRASFDAVAKLRCDVLVTPHPDRIDLFGKLAARERGEADAFVDRDACRRYADESRRAFERQLAAEQAQAATNATMKER